MEKEINRMEPAGANRLIPTINPYVKDLFPDNEEVSLTFQILKNDYGFTSDMLWRIANRLNEKRKMDK